MLINKYKSMKKTIFLLAIFLITSSIHIKAQFIGENYDPQNKIFNKSFYKCFKVVPYGNKSTMDYDFEVLENNLVVDVSFHLFGSVFTHTTEETRIYDSNNNPIPFGAAVWETKTKPNQSKKYPYIYTYRWALTKGKYKLSALFSVTEFHQVIMPSENFVTISTVEIMYSAPAPGSYGVIKDGAIKVLAPVPVLKNISDMTLSKDVYTQKILFNGEYVDINLCTWTNNNPSIGLPGSGTGGIPSFKPINNTHEPIEAKITVTPKSAYKTLGKPVSFKIIVSPDLPDLPDPIINEGSKKLELSNSMTYVSTFIPLTEMKTLNYNNNQLSDPNVQVSVQYLDGLGRPTQTILRGITPERKDIGSIIVYDELGRESEQWANGIVSSNGAYVDPSELKNSIKTSVNDNNPFSKIVYDSSPINRIDKQYGAGGEWHSSNKDKPVKVNYFVNRSDNDTLNCIHYKVSDNSDTIMTVSRIKNYDNGELYVISKIDEDGNTAFEFKDKLDQVVLIRQILREGSAKEINDTYFIYDNFGNLRAVLPPMAASEMKTGNSWSNSSSDIIRNFAYLYKYDKRDRCIRYRAPGTHWIYNVYDFADRLIFTQDGEDRKKKLWKFNIPDVFGRVTIKGVCEKINNNNILSEISVGLLDNELINSKYNGKNAPYHGYTINIGNSTLRLINPVITATNFYDNYKHLELTGFTNDNMKYNIANVESIYLNRYGFNDENSTYLHKGLLTGSMVLQIDDNTDLSYLYNCMYYDYNKRVIQTRSTDHLGGVNCEYVAYNFSGNIVNKRMDRIYGGKSLTEYYTYIYDHANRLVKTTHKIDNNPEMTLSVNSYDEFGRLKKNAKGNKEKLSLNYTYNVRSWIESIKGEYFKQKLYYNKNYAGSKCFYNGNVAAMSWNLWDDLKKEWGSERGYTYEYDNLSRLKSANYKENGSTKNNYSTNYEYDKHGNIKTLLRYGKINAGNSSSSFGIVDKLTYTYNGNQLKNISDDINNFAYAESSDFKDKKGSGLEYYFNANGAMYRDLNKGITNIQYNILNLPLYIQIESESTRGLIKYKYSASGIKLNTIYKTDLNPQNTPLMSVDNYSTTSLPTKTIDYINNKIYENGSLKRILINGGYVEPYIVNGGIKYKYYFYLSDYLGNNRVVATTTGEIIQKNHYYPFGMSFAEGTTAEQGKQPYKFNGKEFEQMHGLNLYDFSARYYEADKGRFMTIDPFAERYYSISPYAYVANNPLKYIDPDGRKLKLVNMPDRTLENIARLAATNEGNRMLSYIIGHQKTINATGQLLSVESTYEDYYADYVLNPSIKLYGAPLTSYIAMGHELRHSYDHLNGEFKTTKLIDRNTLKTVEGNAVSMENYLRQVYSLTPLRDQYPSTGIPKGSPDFFKFPAGSERISNFKFLGRKDTIDKKAQAKLSVAGYSYTKTLENFDIWGRSKGLESRQYYMLVNTDKDRYVTYNIYEDEEEFKKAAGGGF